MHKEGKLVWRWDAVHQGMGIISIRRKSDGMSYFLAVSDMRQRAYDTFRSLSAGTHHNAELQAAWTAKPEDFEFASIAIVRQHAYLSAFKQTFIERAGQQCFNRKNSVAATRPRW